MFRKLAVRAVTRAEKLAALYNEYESNPKLKRLREGATQLVRGMGQPRDPWILFVGEAPGKEEDLQGQPFVGRSGKILNNMLASINLDRKRDVFVTNIVKYRPPNNRDPMPSEKEASISCLLREIEIISPEVICPLGKHALESLFPNERITSAHGVPLYFEGKTFFPMFHPAVMLYDPGKTKEIERDFQKLGELLDKMSETIE